jgi:hypothetical protein
MHNVIVRLARAGKKTRNQIAANTFHAVSHLFSFELNFMSSRAFQCWQ